MSDSKAVVTSRPMPGTFYREHTVTLDGVELRTQMHSFTPEEIAEAIDLWKTMGITTPRHRNGSWNEGVTTTSRAMPGGGKVADPIGYHGLYFED